MKKILKDNLFFGCVCIFFFAYYLYRLFAITPWYDEIYTYINFIDRGAAYSATHWPLPNNHVFFSVLSSFFTGGGVYIGLRGVSLLAAMGTLILLYAFLKASFSGNMALFGSMAYASLMLVNSMAVQGRGYSLATFFLMLGIYCSFCIGFREAKKQYYIGFTIALYLGLYTLVTSVYWVIPVCLCAGILLLVLGRYRELLKLVLASLAAAVMTAVSYGILWLSVGAQQISIDMTSGYYGAKTGFLIREFPRTCLTRGMEFMLQDGNVQSIDRAAFVRDFKFFARDVIGAFFNWRNLAVWYCLLAAVAAVLALTVGTVVKARKEKAEPGSIKQLYAMLLSGVGLAAIYMVLFVQSVYPFARVMSFAGIFLSVLLSVLLWNAGRFLAFLLKKWTDKIRPGILGAAGSLIFFLCCAYWLLSPTYNMEYEYWDYYACDAVRQVDWEEHFLYLAGDVYAQQQVEFHFVLGQGRKLQEELETPQVLILRKEPLTGRWPCLISEEDTEKYDLENRTLVYENTLYRVYE